MNLDFFDNRRVRQFLTIIFLLGVLACLFPPESYTLKRWGSHAELIAMAYLLIGLFFMLFNKTKLMFVCFGCSAAICFFLQETTNSRIKEPEATDMPYLRVAHFDVTSSDTEVDDFFNTILARDADVISMQEVTPDWEQEIQARLAKLYPYYTCISRLDPNGLALYSRFPLLEADTFYYKGLPNLSIKILPEGCEQAVWVVGSILRPPLSGSAYEDLKAHLQRISYEANKINGPVVTVGNYNLVSWSAEILEFREATRLKDSRRGVKPTTPDTKFPLFNVPVDHIFYTDEFFECVGFEIIGSAHSNHIGIEGIFQMRPNTRKPIQIEPEKKEPNLADPGKKKPKRNESKKKSQ